MVERLRTAAICKYPWRQAQPLILEDGQDYADDSPLVQVVPLLRPLPPEIRHMIGGYLEFHPVLQRISALKLYKQLSGGRQERSALGRVYSCIRGHDPVVKGSITEPFFRITVDSLGLRQFERFETRNVEREKNSFNRVYIVEAAEQIDHIMVDFKV
jgi:hypothetical protein